MSELTRHQTQMMALDKEKTRLQMKLREVRSIMRENGIGHLYPGATPEHEEQVQIASEGENYFALQRLAWQNSAESEAWKRMAYNITRWLQLNYPDVRVEMPDNLFNEEIAMELDASKLLNSKKGIVIDSEAQETKGLITNE